MHLFYQSLSTVHRCGGHLLNITFSFLCARCILWPGFIPIRVSCHCVTDVMLLGYESCTWLIRTWITVCSMSFHLLLPEFAIRSSCGRSPSNGVWGINVQKVPICKVFSACPCSNVEWHCLTPEHWICLREHSIGWFLNRVVFSSASRSACACGVAKTI